jgi:WD40 repeat protein
MKIFGKIKGHNSNVTQVAICPSKQYAVSVSIDQSLKVWDLNSGKHIASYSGDSMFYTCRVTPDGKTIVAGDALGQLHFLQLEAT